MLKALKYCAIILYSTIRNKSIVSNYVVNSVVQWFGATYIVYNNTVKRISK